MSYKHLNIGQAEACWNKNYTRVLKYTLEMSHQGLNEHKILSAPDLDMLKTKAQMQADKWNEKWSLIEDKRNVQKAKVASAEEAKNRTQDAVDALIEIENILHKTLTIDDTVDWAQLKKVEPFPENKPIQPSKKKHINYPICPDKVTPVFTFFEKIFKPMKEKKIREYDQQYIKDLKQWEEEKASIDMQNLQNEKNYENSLDIWKKNVEAWEERKNKYLQEQVEYNAKIDSLKDKYANLDPMAIEEYCEIVLNNSQYPESFPKSFELEYNSENKVLIVDYELPSIECFPTLKEVKFIAGKNELKETFISETQLLKIFDETIYKITLRTLHELFEADVADALDAISFNGIVQAINKATGKEENNCIVSIQAFKQEFINIELSKVEPKICFKNLKGVASTKLSSITPIQPILQISRNDRRFVESYDVAHTIDTTTNLAAMDWEDFEHLIRELFQKEFQNNGGEVKVTQASRDGGVDAIAFDPDPIRGGKIVIQAKRYTNTVSVSAVRDLYGTVMNEGATKGILVSTADYGPDAYQFALGKPLTLLNGANLLSLLEKHGHHAKIDLKEAKKMLSM